MPKGRGSTERHRTPRQKLAIRMNSLSYNDPHYINWEEARKRRIRGKPKKDRS